MIGDESKRLNPNRRRLRSRRRQDRQDLRSRWNHRRRSPARDPDSAHTDRSGRRRSTDRTFRRRSLESFRRCECECRNR